MIKKLDKTDLPNNDFFKIDTDVSISKLLSDSELFRFKKVSRVLMQLENSIDNQLDITKTQKSNFIEVDSLEQKEIVLEQTLADAFSKNLSFLISLEKEKIKEQLKKSINDGHVYMISKKSEVFAFLIVKEMQHWGEEKLLVAWIWIKSDIEKQEKVNIRYSLKNLFKTYDIKNIIASIHIQNLASFYFFEKLGFKPVAISLKNI